MGIDKPRPTFFETPAAFRAWLKTNHRTAKELWVGFYKKGSGKPSITWPEAVDEALCFGWIDGVRKSIDDERYTNRFTPRRTSSIWSDINTRRMRELLKAGRVCAAGRKAFEARDAAKSSRYSFEQRQAPAFDAALERRFKANRAAWTFFQAQPPGYRRLSTWWVVSAKREATRLRRLDELIALSADQRRLEPTQPASSRRRSGSSL